MRETVYVPPGWLEREWGNLGFEDRVRVLSGLSQKRGTNLSKAVLEWIRDELRWYLGILAEIRYLTKAVSRDVVRRAQEDRESADGDGEGLGGDGASD